MPSLKTYLQPVATLLAALSLGAIAIDQFRTSNARFNCAHVFGNNDGLVKDLDRLGLSEEGGYANIRGYCRAFISPENSGGGYASIDFPSTLDVRIKDMPNVYGDVGISGSVTVEGSVMTF